MMEPNPPQQGAAATSCGFGGSRWTLGKALPPGGWSSTGATCPRAGVGSSSSRGYKIWLNKATVDLIQC